MVFEIAVGSVKTDEPDYKYVEFKGLTGKKVELDDPVVLVMNTMSRRDALIPEFPKVELPRIDFSPPNTDDLGEEVAAVISKLALKFATSQKYEKIFQKEAAKIASRVPEVDPEEIGKLMKDAVSNITKGLDLDEAIESLLDDLPDIDWGRQFRDIASDLLEDGLDFKTDFEDFLPTLAQFKQLLPALNDIQDKFEEIIDEHLVAALEGIITDPNWLRTIYQTIMSANFSSYYQPGTTTPRDFTRDRNTIKLYDPTNWSRAAFMRLHATLNQLTLSMGTYTYNQIKSGGDISDSIKAFGKNIGKEVIGVLEDQMGELHQTLFEILEGLDDRIKAQFKLIPSTTRKVGVEDNLAYVIYSFAGQAGDKLDGAIEDLVLPLISGLLTDKIVPVFDDIAEQIGIQLAETLNDLLATDVFSEQAKGIGKAIGKEVDSLLKRDLLPHIEQATSIGIANLGVAFNGLWEDNIEPQFDEINGVVDYIQNGLDDLSANLMSFTIEKILMPILSPVEDVDKDGFYVYTKGDQKPVRYIAFSSGDLGFTDTLEGISEYIRKLRDKFEAPWQD